MKRVLYSLAAIAMAFTAFAGSASAANGHKTHSLLTSQIGVQLYEANGIYSGAGATIHCQTNAGTATTVSDNWGFGSCFVPSGTQTAVWATFGPNCQVYYWGVRNKPGYAVWVTPTGVGVGVNVWQNAIYYWC